MAAYAALISLKQVIERLLNSTQISILPPSRKIIKSAYKHVKSLQQLLQRFDSCNASSDRVSALDEETRETVRNLEDVIESLLSDQFLSHQSDESHGDREIHPLILSLETEEVEQAIDSFIETLKKLEEAYLNQLSNPSRVEDDAVSDGKKSKMVGFSDQFHEIRSRILDPATPWLTHVSLVGMGGIGKTTLAGEIFRDPLISSHFDSRAFVKLGQKPQLKEILKGILSQVNPEIDKMLKEGDVGLDELKGMMYRNLKGKRYLLVLDDVWETQAWNDLRRLLHYNRNGSRVLLTTRLQKLANTEDIYEVRLLNREESWDLLREKVFDEDEVCPAQLEKAGRKIAENCDGLPLLIVTVANLLPRAEKTAEYWKKAANRGDSLYMEANDQMLESLFSSYEYLPQHLKACFLYMGAFPRNYEIRHSKLIKLWNAEGFLESSSTELVLEELVSKSLVMVLQKRSILSYRSSPANDIKTCCLHPVFWHLCNREAERNKFSHIVSINSYAGIEHHRQLCIHNNILFAIKDVHKSIASVSNARSLLCTGPPHQYPVPICFGLRLLRVLDALTIRLYEFPLEVVKLVQLRYLALTCNKNLPSSISKLRNLEYLIILRHLSIVESSGSNSSYLPMEIWDMQELKHLQVTGSDLPDPQGAILPNLLTLLDVSPRCCTKELLERISALKKLRIRFDLAHINATITRSSDWFDLLSRLRVRSFKCVALSPIPTSEVASLPAQLRDNYSGVVKLSLSGFGYQWEYMRLIGSLWGLQVLKLQCNAFRGPKWETPDKAFRSLRVLVIEDSDLMHWTAGIKTFRCLERLTMKRCHKLEEIPGDFGGFRLGIEFVDCNSLGVACATRMEEELRKQDRDWLQVSVHSSSGPAQAQGRRGGRLGPPKKSSF